MTKGRVALPFGVRLVMTSSETLFIPGETCRRQVKLLQMTRGQGFWSSCLLAGRTAGPSTTLRSGRDDKFVLPRTLVAKAERTADLGVMAVMRSSQALFISPSILSAGKLTAPYEQKCFRASWRPVE